MRACEWCATAFEANATGRPRRYCSRQCRQDAGHYREDLPRWQAELADLETSAAGYRTVPTFIANQIDVLRRLISPATKGRRS
jgi:hypothetical protein